MDLSKYLSQKTWGAGVGGVVAGLILYGLNTYAHFDFGSAGDSAFIIVLGALVTQLTPPSYRDKLQHLDDVLAQVGTLMGKLTTASDSTQPASPEAQAIAAKLKQ
jgi:hypothetical protein